MDTETKELRTRLSESLITKLKIPAIVFTQIIDKKSKIDSIKQVQSTHRDNFYGEKTIEKSSLIEFCKVVFSPELQKIKVVQK